MERTINEVFTLKKKGKSFTRVNVNQTTRRIKYKPTKKKTKHSKEFKLITKPVKQLETETTIEFIYYRLQKLTSVKIVRVE